MGEWYDFEIRVIDGRDVYGFVYSNERTGWGEVFVEMTDDQKAYANDYQRRSVELNSEMQIAVKSWVEE